jgi:6-phosphogluconolactonase
MGSSLLKAQIKRVCLVVILLTVACDGGSGGPSDGGLSTDSGRGSGGGNGGGNGGSGGGSGAGGGSGGGGSTTGEQDASVDPPAMDAAVASDGGTNQVPDSGAGFADYVFVGGGGAITSYLLKNDGTLGPAKTTNGISNANYLALSPSTSHVFAISEAGAGQVNSFQVARDGALSNRKTIATNTAGPTHLAVNPMSGDTVGIAVANYGDGNVTAVRFDAPKNTLTLLESSQDGDKAHQAIFSANGKYLYIPFLGSDAVGQYQVNADQTFSPLSPAKVSFKAGAGPRHMAIHPNGRWAYVINELDLTMTVLNVGANGTLTVVQSLSTLPAGQTKQPGDSCSHVLVHPNGKWVFGGNRGRNTIVTMQVDESNGTLKSIAHTPSGGRVPRDFGMDAEGRFLFVGAQQEGKVEGFRINATTGALTSLGTVANVNSPAFVGVFRLNK